MSIDPFLEPVHRDWTRRGQEAAAGLEAEGLTHAEARSRDIIRELGRRELMDCMGLASARPDVRALCAVRAELAYRSPLADALFAVQGLGSVPILLFGTPHQRQTYLEPARSGELVAAFALTEPGAGSDLRSIACRAERDGDDYVLRGTKTLISSAGIADYFVLFAQTGEALSAFIVPRDAAGFSVSDEIPLLAPHPIGELSLDEVRLPEGNRLGSEGEGFKIALSTLDIFRPTVGAAAVGMARRALPPRPWPG